MAKFDRKEVSGQLQEHTKDSFEHRKDSGRFGSYFNPEKEIKRWVCGEGDHTIDIIPFIVAEDHPAPSKLKKGKFAYKVDIYVHTNIGPNDDIYVCPTMFSKSRCPICEERKRLLDDGKPWEQVKSMSPQKRSIYNIVCYDTDDEIAKGIQIWDPAFWNMEDHLLRISKNPRTGGIIAFADPWEGRYICFNRTGTKKDNTRYTGHTLYERDYKIEDEFLESSVDPVTLVRIPTYEELYEAFFGMAAETPSQRRAAPAARPAPAAAERDVRDYDAEEAPAPAPARQAPAQRQAPAPAPAAAEAGEATCPSGGIFGSDIDKIEGCQQCTLWNECAKANEEGLPATGSANKPGPSAAGSKLRRPGPGPRR